MNMPPVDRVCSVFPLRVGCVLVSLFGLSLGGFGLAAVISYGFLEDSAVAEYFPYHNVKNDTLKKITVAIIGLNSLVLFVVNVFMFLAVITKSRGMASSAWVVLLGILLLDIIGIMAFPLLCFFLPGTCIVKVLSWDVILSGLWTMALYICFWLYIVVVVWNLGEEF